MELPKSHLSYNNRFKEAVLAEAMRDEREQHSLKLRMVNISLS